MAPPESQRGLPSEVRFIVVIPGITGSVLRNAHNEVVWNARISSIPGRLLGLDELAADRPLTPIGLVRSTTLFDFAVIPGYEKFVQDIADIPGWEIDWGDPDRPNCDAQVVAFPYDFRQSIEESAGKLGELVRQRLKHLGLAGQRNRVLIIAHSMGGLVARHWVAEDNWEICRAVVTLGTPHRGAPKALKMLVDGAPWWTGRTKAIRQLLRGWPAMYALLPRYRMISDLRPVDPDQPAGSAKDLYPYELPWQWLQQPATEAFAMHQAIETAWTKHQSETDCFALRGIGNATLLHSRWDGRRLTTVEEQLPAHRTLSRDLGDGTVPAIAATPIEQSVRLTIGSSLPVRHGRLVTARSVRHLISELLHTAQPPTDDIVGDTLMIGLEINAAYLGNEPATIGAYFHPADLADDELSLACRLFSEDEELPSPQLVRDPGVPWRFTVRLPGLPRGRYRIEVRAVSGSLRALPPRAIEEFFVVPPEDEEPAGDGPAAIDHGARTAADRTERDEAYQGLNYDADLVPSEAEPLTDAEMRKACYAIREESLPVTAVLVERIVATQMRLRQAWEASRTSAPSAAQQESLWLLGWLFYESSWALTQQVRASFEQVRNSPPDSRREFAPGEQRDGAAPVRRAEQPATAGEPARAEEAGPDEQDETSGPAYALIVRLSTSYLRLPWPQWAPRGLGVLRARALAESKRDTVVSYNEAWLWHGEAKHRYVTYGKSTPRRPPRLRLGLDETMLQLALAETGTACRAVERTLGRWGEPADGSASVVLEGLDELGTHRGMFSQLMEGSQFGRDALAKAADIRERFGLVHGVDEDRMAQVTAFRNPGIMTARACLLALPLCAGLEHAGWPVDPVFRDWGEAGAFFLKTFHGAYQALEAEVRDAKGKVKDLDKKFQRPLMHLRVHFGLLMPGAALPSRLDFADCLSYERLDHEAVEATSGWLAQREAAAARRGEGSPIASAMMPSYIHLVEQHRMAQGEAEGGYRDWRVRWFALDRYAGDPGRRAWLDTVLAASRRTS